MHFKTFLKISPVYFGTYCTDNPGKNSHINLPPPLHWPAQYNKVAAFIEYVGKLLHGFSLFNVFRRLHSIYLVSVSSIYIYSLYVSSIYIYSVSVSNIYIYSVSLSNIYIYSVSVSSIYLYSVTVFSIYIYLVSVSSIYIYSVSVSSIYIFSICV